MWVEMDAIGRVGEKMRAVNKGCVKRVMGVTVKGWRTVCILNDRRGFVRWHRSRVWQSIEVEPNARRQRAKQAKTQK